MSNDAIFMLVFIVVFWIGWPPRSIAGDLRKLRELAERRR